MSGVTQNLTEDIQTVLTNINNDEIYKQGENTVEITEKRIDLSSSFQHTVESNNLPATGENYDSEPKDIYDHLKSINLHFDRPIKLEDQFNGSSNREKEKVQPVLRTPAIEDSKLVEEKSDNCPDECICKIKEALGLIVGEVKKVDATISELAVKGQCPYTPQPSDKKEFAKSVEKNSEVCHVIIDELKKQRKEINEMLEMYDDSSREFLKLEDTLQMQRENIDHIENMLESIMNTLENVKSDVADRHERFLLEVESRSRRVETREEILKVFLNWIMSLDSKRLEDRQANESMVTEAIKERDDDRGMLTAAIRQLQEVKRIEILLMTQNATMTQGSENNNTLNVTDTQQTTMPAPLCACDWPINRFTIIPGQCDNNARISCASKISPGVFFNINSNRCAGGADHSRARNTLGTEIPNGNGAWFSPMPIGCYKNMQLPIIQQPRIFRGRRKSPIINARRQR